MIFLVTNLEEDSGDKKQEMMNDLNPGNTITTPRNNDMYLPIGHPKRSLVHREK